MRKFKQSRECEMNFKKIKQILKNQNAGAILIEFAFSIPVLIAILYFILDGPNLRLYQLKLKNSAYLAVNMIQNIKSSLQGDAIRPPSQRQEETDIGSMRMTGSMYQSIQKFRKYVNELELAAITFAAFANIYRSNLMLQDSTGHYPLGHYGHIYLWCIQGNGDGTASVQWVWASGSPGKTPTEFNSAVFRSPSSELNNSIIKFEKSVAPTYIHKDLVIKPNEIKMILEVSIIVGSTAPSSTPSPPPLNEEENSDDQNGNEAGMGNVNSAEIITTPSKKVRSSGAGKLGFYILPLKPMKGTQNSYLNYTVIFKPKSGIFSIEDGPIPYQMLKEVEELVNRKDDVKCI